MGKTYLKVVLIPECKCVNDPIKDDIALHKKIRLMKAQTIY